MLRDEFLIFIYGIRFHGFFPRKSYEYLIHILHTGIYLRVANGYLTAGSGRVKWILLVSPLHSGPYFNGLTCNVIYILATGGGKQLYVECIKLHLSQKPEFSCWFLWHGVPIEFCIQERLCKLVESWRFLIFFPSPYSISSFLTLRKGAGIRIGL